VLDLSFRFDRWIDALPKSPLDAGRVERLVLRTGPGQRATPQRVELRVGAGVVGDTRVGHEHALPENEVALMNVHMLRAVCEGDEARMPLSGDNLLVDLDLSEANLPIGTRLCMGAAVLRVSPVPHRPCDKFVRRFGARAAKRVARANRRGLRGRGVLCTVERGGGVAVGDTIRVERP
jgi:MOSC domain-containing protein YiiM